MQIDGVTAQPRLAQHRRDFRPAQGVVLIRGDRHHVRQSRRQGDAGQPPPVRRQVAPLIQRTQPCQHLPGLGQGACGRRVQQGQTLDRLRPPTRQIQRKGGQVGFLNFRPLMRDQTPRLFLVPQAVADARLDTTRPAPPLFGRRPADLDRRQPRQAAGRLEPGHARQAAVDDHPHALDGQAGFRHRGRQHHLATAGRRRCNGPILLALIQRAVQGDDIDSRIAQPLVQPLDRAVDLALPRQEDQHRTALFAQGLHHRPRHGILESLGGVAAQIEGLDGEHPLLDLDHRRAIQQLGHPRDIQRRRHDQQPQIVAQHRLALARQGQP